MINIKEQKTIEKALGILKRELKEKPVQITDSNEVANFLRLKLSLHEREVFAVMYLDSQNQLIEYREEFFGGVGVVYVHPRIIAKHAMQLNATKVILSHNHPTGMVEESEIDIRLTKEIKEVLSLIDVEVLDHIIIAGEDAMSFVDNGLMPE